VPGKFALYSGGGEQRRSVRDLKILDFQPVAHANWPRAQEMLQQPEDLVGLTGSYAKLIQRDERFKGSGP